MDAWLGLCHLVKPGEDGPSSYETIAAVFCADRDGFEAALRVHVAGLGYQLLWAEEVHPAGPWLARHAKERGAAELARAVHQGHRVELGNLRGVGAEGEDLPQTQYLTIEDHDIPALPDQSGMPFWDQQWIAPELKALLFGQPETGPALRTYLIVDATLRKNITGVFDLDSIDAPIRCLFKGEAAEELKESAPYLIDMTLPAGAWEDRDLVPSFHRSFFKTHWGQNTGVFIRTTALMAEVWNHYRKFTLVPRDGFERRVFVAFWSAQYVQLYFPHIADNADRVALWFLRDGFAIDAMIADQSGGASAKSVTLNRDLFARNNRPPAPFVVTEYDLEPFYRDRTRKDLLTLSTALKQDFADEMKHYSPDTLAGIIAEPLNRMRSYGFTDKGHMYILALWSVFFGQNFETKDPAGTLMEICKSDMDPTAKMTALKDRMQQLSVPGEAAQ